MELLIRLRLSMDKLDHHEWIQFTHIWTSLLDRNIISSSIYYYFHHHKIPNPNYNLQLILTSVENIIKSREETTRNRSKSISSIIEQTNSLSLTPDQSEIYRIKLNQLPTDLIGDIASYLDQSTYSHFELLCRQTYIACNNPSTLHTLNLLQCPHINYNIKNKYSLIKSIYINAMHLTQYMQIYPNQLPFSRLTTLRISNVISPQTLTQFIQHNNLINFPSITHLTCDYFVNIVHHGPGFQVIGDFDLYALYGFLSRFPALEVLRLVQIFTREHRNDDDEIIANLLPNLRRLSVMNCKNELVNKIINQHGHKLETLMLLDQDCSLIDSIQGFPKLTELSLVAPSVNVINRVLRDTLCLKRFGMGIQHDQNMTHVEFQQLLTKLFETQYLLEYVGLDIAYRDFGLYMDAIKQSLAAIWRIHKHEFKIGIHVHFCNENMIKRATFYIPQVMHRLRRSNIGNYILFVRFLINDEYEYVESVVERNKMLKNLNETYLAYHKTCLNPRHECFVVANKNCTINGYSSGWQPLL